MHFSFIFPDELWNLRLSLSPACTSLRVWAGGLCSTVQHCHLENEDSYPGHRAAVLGWMAEYIRTGSGESTRNVIVWLYSAAELRGFSEETDSFSPPPDMPVSSLLLALMMAWPLGR